LPDSYRPSDCPSDYTLDELRWRNKNNQKGVHYDEWRALLDALADLFLAAKDDQGKPIPLQFRPFHEFTGNWFWWGHQNPADVYQSAWVEMVQYLRNDRGVHNLLLVFCPNTPSSNGFSFEPYYPGDDFVDVVGFDRYDFNDGNFVAGFAADIETMGTFARAHGKVAAVTEVGFALHNYGLTTRPQWFTDSLVGPLFLSKGAQEFAYVAPWRNAPWEKYMPEAGDGAIADNFRSMVSSQRVLLQDAQRNLYRSLGVLPTVSPPGPSGSTPRTPTSNGS
jgi:hypothetical protein